MLSVDMDKVTEIIREVSAEEIAPRFGQLEKGDIDTKTHAMDLVTIADTEAERVLTKRFCDLLPGSVALGEEAAHADPKLPERVFGEDATIWIIDPVDGTKNFAHHKQPFRCMVALYHGGETFASWIVYSIVGSATFAEKGARTYPYPAPFRCRALLEAAILGKFFLYLLHSWPSLN